MEVKPVRGIPESRKCWADKEFTTWSDPEIRACNEITGEGAPLGLCPQHAHEILGHPKPEPVVVELDPFADMPYDDMGGYLMAWG